MSEPAETRARVIAVHYAHCDALLRKRDRDLWLACLFAPQAARPHMHAIYAFALETADVRTKVSQPLLGEMRLRWWADAIEAAPSANVGGARAHPVADALLDTIERFALPREETLALIDAHGFDLYDEPMSTVAELENYCRATTSGPMRWAARILGAAPAPAHDDAGVALGLTRLLCALPRHAHLGQVFAPAALLARHGASPDDIRARAATKGVIAALADLRALARARYDSARQAAATPTAGREALLPAATVPLYLERMARKDYDPFRTLVDPPPWRRQWRLWRAARGVGL